MEKEKYWPTIIVLVFSVAMFSFIFSYHDNRNAFTVLTKESICQPDLSEHEYFSVKEGQVIKFDITVSAPVRTYNEIVIGISNESFAVYVDRDEIIPEKYGKGVLELKVGKSGSPSANLSMYQGFENYYGRQIEIVQDTFGLYRNVSELYWLSDMAQCNYYEACEFKKEYIDSYLQDFATENFSDNGAYPGAYSIRPIFVLSVFEQQQYENLQLGHQNLSNEGIVSLNSEYPGVSLLLMDRFIDSDFLIDDNYIQKSWFSKKNGLEKLEQRNAGKVVMTWKRVDK